MALSCIISEIKARYWSKSRIIYTLFALDDPVSEVRIGLLRYHLVWKNKNGVLPDGERSVICHFKEMFN